MPHTHIYKCIPALMCISKHLILLLWAEKMRHKNTKVLSEAALSGEGTS